MNTVTTSHIDVQTVLNAASSSNVSGVNLFVQSVRSHSHGARVSMVEYSTDVAQAREILSAIERTLHKRWQLEKVVLILRVGKVHVGEPLFVAAVSSSISRAAFAACRYAIESMRTTIPLQTKESFEEGLAWYVGQHDIDVCSLPA